MKTGYDVFFLYQYPLTLEETFAKIIREIFGKEIRMAV